MVTKLFPPGLMDRETDRQISGLAIRLIQRRRRMHTYIHTYIHTYGVVSAVHALKHKRGQNIGV